MAWTLRLIALGALVVGCRGPEVGAAPLPDAGTGPGPSAAVSASASPSAPPAAGLSDGEAVRLFRELSEQDRYFFSDNYVSNETSYLQPTAELAARAKKGGAYIGVGPEQNFTYLALLEPKLAFIVDIRRANAVHHLLYKAIFEEATSRSHFVALLLGRAHDAKTDPGPDARIEAVLAHATGVAATPRTFDSIHALLTKKIRDKGFVLGPEDEKTLAATHRAFFDRGLDLSFELHEKNGRKYPKLSELLGAKDAGGETRGFLGSEAAFRSVQRLQRENRVIPVVGDFGGDQALIRIGAELKKRDLPVSVFYTSNVEQYLMEPDKWKAWTRNVDALPSNEQSLFLRCYLDQGRRHPRQMDGHRTATVVASFDHFKWRNRTRGYGSFFQLVTDGVDVDAGH
ncbi:MAG: hypothetical protein IT377_05540 [Polyangiaceae bacterium]|nr:hypothetical protein [Polyangiaceae bacterium]